MPDEFLTVQEVAELLRVNQQTVRNWIERGQLRALRVGTRRVRVRRSDLDAFIAAGSTARRPQRAAAGQREYASAALAERRARLEPAEGEDDPSRLAELLAAIAESAQTLADRLKEN
jgi:excisionase family DNA binding protein